MENPVKGDFHLARRSTTVGGVVISAGSMVMVVNGATGRDPRRFGDPNVFRPDRTKCQVAPRLRARPACPWGPLARTETRITLERLLARTTEIHISEAANGTAGKRRYQYLPTYILRGLQQLELEFTY